MSIRRPLVATVACIGALLTGLAAPSAGAAAEPITPSQKPAGNAVRTHDAPALARQDANLGRADGATGERSTTAAGVIELPGYCPTGFAPGKLLNKASFEGALPYPADSYGFNATTNGGATDGSYNASSTISAGYPLLTYVNSTHVPVPAGTRIGMSFSYTGFGPDTIGFSVNNSGGTLAPTTTWSRVALDVTSEARTNAGFLDAFFFNDTSVDSSQNSTMRVDEVRVYTCVPTPFKRGDWTGDQRVDLLGIHGSGDLYLYPGTGTGDIVAGTRVGPGWGSFTWAGSPGDVDSNSISDLLGVSADGTLYLYSGRGNGAFATRRAIGTGWDVFSAITTPTDVTGDGSPDLIARDADGTLNLYAFDTFGEIKRVKEIGWKFNGMKWIIGMGDLNRDARGDVVAVNATDGCLYAYNATSAPALKLHAKVGCGWSAMTWLTSPGDLNGDGLGDLVARDANGQLFFYPGRTGGGVYSAVKVGSGWTGMKFIL
ncbi:putative secreted protein [Janibacter sp. HTCC2649]|uniref:FG-GAP repeat domain-containing protein n=1 Tax=Janibacter sp. HTCC2649 TaxID=313589 RepID=UPI0000671019|nr:VCBS repeat-containing protein [Janibacter sp. HTCC2649]EAP97507.1 putative secreted protein [Janibacter sp. HTCC2649]